MSNSPSYCVGASPGTWGMQGNDITSQLERRDWMRKNLTGSSIKVVFSHSHRMLRIPLSGHHILPGQPVGHLLLLFTEPGELQKLLLWGWLLGPIQWSRR